MKYNIAIGKSRTDKTWKNKQVTWEDFLKKISTTHRTAETIEDYFGFKKERQDEIKDVGGFVGGHLSGGRRLSSAVTSRSLLTFDADEATPDFFDRFCLLYGSAAAIYSTHKHTAEKPRFRLIIPLTREVFVDEYAAICRRIADDIGMDMFDITGFQPHRLMYWPSTSKDGEFIFNKQDGEPLNPDEVLKTYRDWTDVSEWPRSKKESKKIVSESKKQGDPFEKPGLIGAFNRAYTIQEAIEKYLSDIYESTDTGRYTYKEGSTSAGVVIYEDKFCYSHHSTDPTCEILCNAFDLVRIHKFGLLDDADSDTPINKRPSYVRMCDFVSEDSFVKQQLGEAKIEAAKKSFEEVVEATDLEIDLDWLKDVDVDRKGNYLNTINNIALILENDPIFKNNIAFDEFRQQAIFKRRVPWRKVNAKPIINDSDLANIENHIEKVYKLTCGTRLIKGLMVVLEKHSFHPVVDYLRSLKWDGVERLDGILIKYLGAEDTNYTRTVTKKTLIGAVARVMIPGIKFDNILTLVGKEGQGKSQLWDRLGGEWFSDTFNMHMLQSKEAYEQIQGVWIIEIGELAGLAKVEQERVKGFVSARKDNYRSPYTRTTEQRLRQCLFVASTNKKDFLKSQTGNRRFWPVPTFMQQPEDSVYNMTKQDVDQIWAEATYYFMQGEELHLNDAEIEEAKAIQEEYTEQNPLVEQIVNFLSKDIPKNWYFMGRFDKLEFMANYDEQDKEELVERTKVCKYEIWQIVMEEKGPLTMMGSRIIGDAMDKIETWERSKEAARFGNSYPRHKGSYVKKMSFKELF